MKKLYESPSAQKCILDIRTSLMNGDLPTVSDNGYGWADGETPWDDENR